MKERKITCLNENHDFAFGAAKFHIEAWMKEIFDFPTNGIIHSEKNIGLTIYIEIERIISFLKYF